MHFSADPTHYLTIPTRTASLTASLAQALLAAAPKAPSEPLAKRLARIELKAEALQKTWTASTSKTTELSTRAADISLDRCWSASRSRVASWIEIDDEDHREDAERVMAAVFPTGLDFLRLPYRSEWAESERRLALLDEDPELGALFEDLVDARIIKRLRDAHASYGEVLGITEAPAAPSEGRLVDAINQLRVELAGYARLALGLTEEDDPKAVAETERWLEPILRYRESINRRGKESEVEVDVLEQGDTVPEVEPPAEAPEAPEG